MDELPLTRKLDDLMDALEDAQGALALGGHAAHQLAEAYAGVAALAASLDPVQHPEVSAHIQRLCDICVERLRERNAIAIASVIALFAPVRASLADPRQNVTYRPPAAKKRSPRVSVPVPDPRMS